ncbi:Chemotaxis protein methyltransferase [Sulfitobacter noctilucae]|uniref:CheR family methyltransferase n=1 Tax=Sulfitobacter noctilucae TaxID=1342302 RepID=UPI0004693EA9|nr:protein-glutamate O-methyltransferase CheR [Sulfitobacter noctilucae]KIN61104.1 Chemotaxis protein methyltransferase [Sulfitobacter noctilucae]
MSTSASQQADLDPASFRAIADLAYRESGLTLVQEKSSMIQSRLRHRLRDLGLADFAAYCSLVQSDAGQGERRNLISALTTNVSHFFRESHHFDVLRAELDRHLPKLRAGGQLRIWSAGCSNGQEALSAAMTLLDHVPDVARLDLRILATDIDPEVVQFARKATYPERLVRGISPDMLKKYFDQTTEAGHEPSYIAKPVLTDVIRVNELNLLSPWPMRKRFDIIFCRNVVIYFDQRTQEKLWPSFLNALAPDGVLLLGHSERIAEPERYGFTCTGPTTYRPCHALKSTARPEKQKQSEG